MVGDRPCCFSVGVLARLLPAYGTYRPASSCSFTKLAFLLSNDFARIYILMSSVFVRHASYVRHIPASSSSSFSEWFLLVYADTKLTFLLRTMILLVYTGYVIFFFFFREWTFDTMLFIEKTMSKQYPIQRSARRQETTIWCPAGSNVFFFFGP